MARIKNMGTATMKFGEGVIISGNASEPGGTDSGFNLIVSGNVKIAEGADLIFQKGESESSFIQFKNATDGTSYNAYFAYQQAEHLYISAGRGADFYLQQRTGIGGDPYTFPMRVFDDGRVKFEVGQSDSNASATDLPDDVVFFVSGSRSGTATALFTGNVYISGGITSNDYFSSPGPAIFGGNIYVDQHIRHTGDVDTLINFTDGTIEFDADGVTQLRIDDTAVTIGTGGISNPDVNFLVSGSMGSRGTSTKGTSVFGGDVLISGSLYTKQRHINTAKYTESSADPKYVRWDAAGSNGTPGVNNKFLAPASGKLLSVTIRATSAANGTNISFHKASNGTEDLNTTATETIGVDMASANTAYQVEFTDASSFNAGDILGIRLDPTNGFGNVNVVCVWEFDFTD